MAAVCRKIDYQASFGLEEAAVAWGRRTSKFEFGANFLYAFPVDLTASGAFAWQFYEVSAAAADFVDIWHSKSG